MQRSLKIDKYNYALWKAVLNTSEEQHMQINFTVPRSVYLEVSDYNVTDDLNSSRIIEKRNELSW